jgi:hypothetical protein
MAFAMIECVYRLIDKATMSERLLSKTPDWMALKPPHTITSPDVVPQKTMNSFLVTYCRKYCQGEWEKKRTKTTNQFYSLALRQVGYSCMSQVILKTQSKLKSLLLLMRPDYFGEVGIVCVKRNADEERELRPKTDFDTATWNASSPGYSDGGSGDGDSGAQSNVDPFVGAIESTGSLQYLSDQYLAGSSLRPETLSLSSSDVDVLENREDVENDDVENDAAVSTTTTDDDDGDDGDDDDDDDGDDDVVMLDQKEDQTSGDNFVTSSGSISIIELDFFNRNPTMEYFVHLIDIMDTRIANNKFLDAEPWSKVDTRHPDNVLRAQLGRPIFPVPTNASEPPTWMRQLRKIMVDNNIPMESRLFVLKIIMHRPSSFAPYARLFVRPILTLAVLYDNGKQPFRGFHYFLRDCCRLLEHWWVPDLSSKTCPPGCNPDSTGVQDARAFVTHLMQCCPDEDTQILKSNLYHVRSIFELYSTMVDSGGEERVVDPCVPWQMFICRGKEHDAAWLTSMLQHELGRYPSSSASASSSSSSSSSSAFSSENANARKIANWRDRMHRVSLHLMAACIRNKYPLQSRLVRTNIPLPEKQLYTHKKFGLAAQLEHRNRTLRDAAAVVIGMILHRARKKSKGGIIPTMSPAGQLLLATHTTLKRVLDGASVKKGSSVDVVRQASKYLLTIERIADIWPYILTEKQVETIITKMTQVHGDDRARCLRLLTKYVHHTSRSTEYVVQQSQNNVMSRKDLWIRMRPHLLVRHDLIERYHVNTQLEVIRYVEAMSSMDQESDKPWDDVFVVNVEDMSMLLNEKNQHSMTWHMTQHEDIAVRTSFYKFVSRMFVQRKDVSVHIHCILVNGLSDPAQRVRKLAKYFWDVGIAAKQGKDATSPISTDITTRLATLLTCSIENSDEQMGKMDKNKRNKNKKSQNKNEHDLHGLYRVGMEERWLEYSSYLTIALSKRSVDYERHLPGCEDALQDCEFVEIDVSNLAAHTVSRTMQPKYASLVSQLSQISSSGGGSGGGGGTSGRSQQHFSGTSQYTFSQRASQYSSQNGEDSSGGGDVGYILATQENDQLRYLSTQSGGGMSLAYEQSGQNRALLSMVPSSLMSSSGGSSNSSKSSRKRSRDDNGDDVADYSGGNTFSNYSAFASQSLSSLSSLSFQQKPDIKRARLIPSVPSFDTSDATATSSVSSVSSTSASLPFQQIHRFQKPSRKRTYSSAVSQEKGDSSSGNSTAVAASNNGTAHRSMSASRDGALHSTEIKSRIKAAAQRRERNQQRRKVTVFRQYRLGELPDVQITVKDVMRPLSALCEHDNVISRAWMSTLFHEVAMNSASPGGDDGDDGDGGSKEGSMDNVLCSNGMLADRVSSVLCTAERSVESSCNNNRSTAVTSCLLQFYHDLVLAERMPTPTEDPHFHLVERINNISNAAIQSSNYHMGALVLEAMLHSIDDNNNNNNNEFDSRNNDNTSETRRALRMTVSLCLSKLYTLTRENDVVNSLSDMQERVHSEEEEEKGDKWSRERRALKNAADQERSGHRESALQIYRALSKNMNERQEEQEELEELEEENGKEYVTALIKKGLLSCSTALQQWDVVNDVLLSTTECSDDELADCTIALLSKGGNVEDVGHFIQYCLSSSSSSNCSNEMISLVKFLETSLDNVGGTDSSSSSSTSSSSASSASSATLATNNNQRALILGNYSLEAALAFISTKNYDRALPMLEHTVTEVSKRWTELHPLAKAERHALLSKMPLLETLQQTMDLRNTFITYKGRVTHDGVSMKEMKLMMMKGMTNVIDAWRKCAPSIVQDDPIVWEQLRVARTICLRVLDDTYHILVESIANQNLNRNQVQLKKSSRVERVLQYGQQHLLLQCAEGMMGRGCHDVADVYLTSLQEMEGQQLLLSPSRCAYVYYENMYTDVVSHVQNDQHQQQHQQQHHHKQEEEVMSTLKEIIDGTEDFYESTTNEDEDEDEDDADGEDLPPLRVDSDVVRLNFIRADAYNALSRCGSRDTVVGMMSSKSVKEAMKAYEHSVSLIDRTKDADEGSRNIFWEPMLRYAVYCSDVLASKSAIGESRESLVVNIIKLSLRSLRLFTNTVCNQQQNQQNSTTTAETTETAATVTPISWFPRVLSLLRPWVGCEAVVSAFDEGTRHLPSYLLLQWNSQLLSLCGGHKYTSITSIILHNLITPMLLNYPDAVWYNFVVMYEQLDEESMKMMTPLYNRIQQSPKGKALCHFSAAIRCTLLPQNRYLDGIESLSKMFPVEELQHGKGGASSNLIRSNQWKEKRKAYGKQLMSDVCGREKEYVGKWVGSYQREFTRKHKDKLTSLLNKALHSSSDLKKLKASLRDKMKEEVYKDFYKKPLVSTDSCTEWFRHYDPDQNSFNEEDDENDNENEGMFYDEDGDIEMSTSTSSTSSNRLLRSSSPNLASSFALHDTDIEIPGIYQTMKMITTFAPPRKERNPKIASFGLSMLQLDSVRKPRRLTIVGSDYIVRHLLCKGGEDLRNDQRIEQLFTHMNTIFLRTSTCRHLRNITYGVVPMTSNHGVVEWLEDTEPLKEAYIHQIEQIHQEEEERQARQARNHGSNRRNTKKKKTGAPGRIKISLSKDYMDFVKKETGKDAGQPKAYYALYKKSKDTSKDFKRFQQSSSPSNTLLRRRLTQMSSSSEVFHALRRQMTRCVAVNSICGYLLGMGDRHLENFLVSKKDGTLAAIDFGMSFGTATFLLPVPELIPFRLTHQFLNVMAPLDGTQLLRHDMCSAMFALRSNRSSLLAITDVFVHDPLVEWTKKAANDQRMKGGVGDARLDDIGDALPDVSQKANAAGGGGSGGASDSSASGEKNNKEVQLQFDPKGRINIMRKKLIGAHPSDILYEELCAHQHGRIRQMRDSHLKGLLNGRSDRYRHVVCAGDDSKENRTALSVEAQVDCLIDLATDPNICTRSWMGLQLWM